MPSGWSEKWAWDAAVGENFSLLLNAKCFYCVNKCEYKLLKLSMPQNWKKINFMPLDILHKPELKTHWPFQETSLKASLCPVMRVLSSWEWVRQGLSAVRREVRVKATNETTGLVNHIKEAMWQKESEYQSLSGILWTLCAKTLKLKAFQHCQISMGQMENKRWERLSSYMSLRTAKHWHGPLVCPMWKWKRSTAINLYLSWKSTNVRFNLSFHTSV